MWERDLCSEEHGIAEHLGSSESCPGGVECAEDSSEALQEVAEEAHRCQAFSE